MTITRHGNSVARPVPAKASGEREIGASIAKLKQFSKGQTLGGGLKVEGFISEGRR
jgi:antitoxin (DNA-binding transcriptional repressor) of toxin-antitoxin stability system